MLKAPFVTGPLLLFTALLASFSGPSTNSDGPPQDKPIPLNKPKACAECHPKQYEEWKGTLHAKSWVDEAYQRALKHKRRPQSCYACHIPGPFLERLPKRPRARKELKDAGISCSSCHEGEGKIHGPLGIRNEAHPSVKSAVFAKGSSDLCITCHKTKVGPVLPLAKDFLASPLPKKGKTCMSCHMGKVERSNAIDPKTGKEVGPKRKGRSHSIQGPTNPKFLAHAFRLEADFGKEKTSIQVQNRAGHRIPGLLMRAFQVEITAFDSQGKTLWSKKALISGKASLAYGKALSFEAPKAASVQAKVAHLFSAGRGIKNLGIVYEKTLKASKK
jgi:nitrate/TMAO reductase-like tetraheme cytochrome c subunit